MHRHDCLSFLAYFLIALYLNNKTDKDLELAKSSLEFLVKKINAGTSEVGLPFLGMVELGILYPLIIIPIGIAGATTTYNFLAGFNGLEARQGIIILTALSIVSYFTGNSWLALVGMCMVFSLLALRYDSGIKTDCKDAILDNAEKVSDKPKCWPKDRCSIKNTAQAVLALSRIKVNTDEAEAWLLSQNTTPTNLDWYLQIESEEETACTLSYGPEYSITIGTDKKITGDAGSCLPIDTAGGSYWLRISSASDCYDRTYTILCDKSFITTLLYKKSGSLPTYA